MLVRAFESAYLFSLPIAIFALRLFLLNYFWSALQSALYAQSRGDAGYFPLCTPVLALTSRPKLAKLLKNSLCLEGFIVEA